jgi:dTDP-N-acetylfucosamine:lipid II N-acetylfucosaminyltransferase
MSLQKYLNLLNTIDIAVFNHRRQQGAGNIVHLLGFGKKVYLRPEVSTWRMLTALGVEVYDTRNIELTRLHPVVAEGNALKIRQNFSLDVLRSQWRALLHDEWAQVGARP